MLAGGERRIGVSAHRRVSVVRGGARGTAYRRIGVLHGLGTAYRHIGVLACGGGGGRIGALACWGWAGGGGGDGVSAYRRLVGGKGIGVSAC